MQTEKRNKNLFFSLEKPVIVYLSMAIQSFTNIKESNMVSNLFNIFNIRLL